MKSPGNRSGFRFTDCTRTRVSTPYSAASSVSGRTLRPRRTTMDLAIRSAGISVGAVCFAAGSRARRVKYIQPE